MSAVGFNRERAQRILEAGWLADQSDFTGDTDDLLDLLAECVVNAPDHTLEGRDWIGNPDGTLVYWQAEADAARAKLAAIEELIQGLTRIDVLLMPELRARLSGNG